MIEIKYTLLGFISALVLVFIGAPAIQQSVVTLHDQLACRPDTVSVVEYKIDTVVVDRGEPHYLLQYAKWRLPDGYRVLELNNGSFVPQKRKASTSGKWENLICADPATSVAACLFLSDPARGKQFEYRSEAAQLIDRYHRTTNGLKPKS